MTDFIKLISKFSNSSSNTNIIEGKRQVVTRLKFIASITPNEKIDSQNLRIESSNILTPLKRFFYGDSRQQSMNFFTSTIDRTIEIIDAHIHTKSMSEKIFCANIINDLVLAITGLRAFQKTYESDKLISCEIDVIIETIEAKLYSIKQSNPEMFTIKKQFTDELDKNKFRNITNTKPSSLMINPNKNFEDDEGVNKNQYYRISHDNGLEDTKQSVYLKNNLTDNFIDQNEEKHLTTPPEDEEL